MLHTFSSGSVWEECFDVTWSQPVNACDEVHRMKRTLLNSPCGTKEHYIRMFLSLFFSTTDCFTSRSGQVLEWVNLSGISEL